MTCKPSYTLYLLYKGSRYFVDKSGRFSREIEIGYLEIFRIRKCHINVFISLSRQISLSFLEDKNIGKDLL